MTTKVNLHQEKSKFLKEINYLYQSPTLTEESREKINSKIKEIRDFIKQELNNSSN